MVETDDEWITTRTGIKERRIAPAHIDTTFMAVEAARNCLKHKNLKPQMLISTTATHPSRYPYLSALVAEKLKFKNLACFDMNCACSGSIFALSLARGVIETMDYKNVLITSSEKMTSFVDYTDRASCVLFGDGASAIMISQEDPEHEILDVVPV